MKRVHIIGGKNHGKTTLVAELVQELTARGLCVGTIKHTHHHHELDSPGKDSHRHREAGAAAVGILSPSMNAVFWLPNENEKSQRDKRYDSFSHMFAQCDLILVEGDSQTSEPKIEVWRGNIGKPPLALEDATIAAVVTEDQDNFESLGVAIPTCARRDIFAIADLALSLARG